MSTILSPHHACAQLQQIPSQQTMVSNEGPPNPEVLLALLSRNKALEASIPKCCGCEHMILDRFILKVLDRTWHTKCLKCHECGSQLAEKCFARNGQVFCKEDFFKRFGTRCAGCDQGIPPTQVVRRAQDNVYHLQCFSCIMCSRQLNTGDEFYLMDDKKLVCKSDFESAKAKDGTFLEGDQPNKRPRTTITAKQLETLKTAYNNSPKPARHIREQLSQDTGLDMRVVQVWFQNRRAKEKRLKKDAGRTRWGQYFRNIKGHRSKGDASKEAKDASDADVSFNPAHSELSSNDGYSTPVNLAIESGGDHVSSHPLQGHSASFIPGPGTPPYLPSSHSPPPGTPHHPPPLTAGYPYSEGLTMYTQLGQGPPPPGHLSNHVLSSSGPGSDMSNGSSNQGYPDFPPSPESWLSDMDNSTHGQPY